MARLMNRRSFRLSLLAAAAVGLLAGTTLTAQARVTRIVIDARATLAPPRVRPSRTSRSPVAPSANSTRAIAQRGHQDIELGRDPDGKVRYTPASY